MQLNPTTSFMDFVSKCGRSIFGKTAIYSVKLNKLRSRVKQSIDMITEEPDTNSK